MEDRQLRMQSQGQKHIYLIKNIPKTAGPEQIRELFSQFGHVADLSQQSCLSQKGFRKMPKVHTISFWKMEKDPLLANIYLFDSLLFISKLGQHNPTQKNMVPLKLFVKNVAKDCTEHEMRLAFEPFGEVLEAINIVDQNTGKPRGFGYVVFKDASKVPELRAFQNIKLRGRIIRVETANSGYYQPNSGITKLIPTMKQVKHHGVKLNQVDSFSGALPSKGERTNELKEYPIKKILLPKYQKPSCENNASVSMNNGKTIQKILRNYVYGPADYVSVSNIGLLGEYTYGLRNSAENRDEKYHLE